ncbi:hypothetical protein RJ640_012195 [Escallonia rubra]|uniref:GAG-pre-integrase domain-containing protein n=1 Tax=Escallonia rubra TaxID=112253 RepID=A0AA88R019_9ASTE|nr:hypothetical protein RJ640_012195 [Escallonia rubra]
MRMSESGSVVDHLNDFNGVINQLESIGINLDDEIRVMLFMCSLPDSWNNLVTTVSNSTVSGMLTINDVVMDDNFKVWYVDSGASIHCTPHRDCFRDYVHGDYRHVIVKNRYQRNIVEKGKVEIKLSNGGTLVLQDIRHIPELQKNLISVRGVDREGYFVEFGEKQWKAIKGSMVVTRSERVETLYTLSGTYNHSISLASTENQRTTLWHHSLGHLSESGIRILHLKNALPRMKNNQLDFCKICVYGKKKWVSFQRDGKEKKTEKLELVHTDVRGPITVKSHGGVSIVMEGFKNKCSNNGIRLIRIVNRTPQENGLTERMNRTIMERARSRDVIFDESQLYKHKLQEREIEKENREYMELDEPEDGQVPKIENSEVLDETTDAETGADNQQVAETPNHRRSSRGKESS